LAEIAQTLNQKERQPSYEPAAASIYNAQPYDQDNSFLIVGERLNASGSKVPQLLNAEDGLVSMAKYRYGKERTLDVNVDYVGRDGVEICGTGVPRCDKCDAAADAGLHGMGKMEAGRVLVVSAC